MFEALYSTPHVFSTEQGRNYRLLQNVRTNWLTTRTLHPTIPGVILYIVLCLPSRLFPIGSLSWGFVYICHIPLHTAWFTVWFEQHNNVWWTIRAAKVRTCLRPSSLRTVGLVMAVVLQQHQACASSHAGLFPSGLRRYPTARGASSRTPLRTCLLCLPLRSPSNGLFHILICSSADRCLTKFQLHFRRYIISLISQLPIPVAARSKAWVFVCSLAVNAGSNPTGDMDVCLSWVLCVVRWRSLRGTDCSSRRFLPSVVRSNWT